MSDTFQVMKSELEDLLDDAVFASAGSLNSMLLTWTNRLIKDIHLEIDIRRKLSTSDIAVTGATHVFDITSSITDFFKISNRFTKVQGVSGVYIDVITLETLNSFDPDHDATTTGNPAAVAIEGNYLYVYPLTTATCALENYFAEPTDMTATSSSPDLPWIYFVTDMVVSGVAGKYGFPYLNEYEQAKYWYNKDKNNPGVYQELLEKYRLHVGKSNSIKAIERIFY
jgi:hypothetical protein